MMALPTDPNAPKPVSAPVARLPQFEQQRKVANQRLNAAGQQATEAMQRKLASIGNLNSGAALKQQQNINEGLNQQREETMGAIDAGENQEVARQQEVQDARNFAANEAKLQRDLQSGQFDKTFEEQKRQNAFNEKIAGDEFKLNKFMTKYNAALSLGTSGAKNNIKAAFEEMFPGEALEFSPDMAGPDGPAYADGAVKRREGSIARDDWKDLWNRSGLKDRAFLNTSALQAGGGVNPQFDANQAAKLNAFVKDAAKQGYTYEAIERAARRGGFNGTFAYKNIYNKKTGQA